MLAAAAAHVAERLGALAAPAPRLTIWRLALPTGVLIATAVAVAVAFVVALAVAVAVVMNDTEGLSELAQHHYRSATH